MASPPDDQAHDTIEVTNARQGPTGKRILAILLVATGAAAILLVLAMIFLFLVLPDSKTDIGPNGQPVPQASSEAAQAFETA